VPPLLLYPFKEAKAAKCDPSLGRPAFFTPLCPSKRSAPACPHPLARHSVPVKDADTLPAAARPPPLPPSPGPNRNGPRPRPPAAPTGPHRAPACPPAGSARFLPSAAPLGRSRPAPQPSQPPPRTAAAAAAAGVRQGPWGGRCRWRGGCPAARRSQRSCGGCSRPGPVPWRAGPAPDLEGVDRLGFIGPVLT
jgi:hypothetical protein